MVVYIMLTETLNKRHTQKITRELFDINIKENEK